MADKKSIKMLNIKRKKHKSKPIIDQPEKIKIICSQNISNLPEELSFKEDYSDNEIEEGQQENSLCQLTKKVIEYIKNKKKLSININELVKDLCVKKRRIYDITNVLQGIGYIEKKGKNEIIWLKNQIFKKDGKIKNNLLILEKQINKINNLINNAKEEFLSISRKIDFNKFAYITFHDLERISQNEKIDFLIIKASKGTKVEIMDKKNARKACEEILRKFKEGQIELDQKNFRKVNLIKNESHIFLDSNNQNPNSIKVYRFINGEVNQLIKDIQKGMYYCIYKDNNIKKEYNFIKSSKEIESNYEIKNNDSNYIKVHKTINSDLTQSLKTIQNNRILLDDINNKNNKVPTKRFSLYELLKWNENSVYNEKKSTIKKKYCGISSLFQNFN